MRSLTKADLAAIEREYCSRSLSSFVKRAWPHIDPQPYVHGWHMDALGEHLEACARGQITRLLINIPPGTSKSTASSVFFPAWLWGPFGRPQAKFIGASYEQGLATRDNRKTRLLIALDWYQSHWPIQLTSDQNEKTGFENAAQGFRQSCAVKSMTGKRGDFVVWDDPLSPEKAYSQVERDTANRVFAETLPLRLTDQRTGVIIVIMQRLHENDVSGYILSRDLGYEHLCLPMEYEAERACSTSIGFKDPRTKDGDLLFSERFPREVVERDKKVMGSFATAGQFQQRPVPREGGMFKAHWFNYVDAVPVGTKFVRGWDMAASTRDTSAYTAGVMIGKTPEGRFIIADARRERTEAPRRYIVATAEEDSKDVRISYPQDPGQAGKDQAASIAKDLSGYSFTSSPESGDKAVRAEPLAAQAEAGNLDILRGSWNAAYVDELCAFPFGEFADQVDASSRAFNELAGGSTYNSAAWLT
ncbi:MAG: phage terminase large subunit [Pseudomonadota bacterium]